MERPRCDDLSGLGPIGYTVVRAPSLDLSRDRLHTAGCTVPMSSPEPTDELLGVLHLATEFADQLGHAEVTPEHVLLALVRHPSTAAALASAGGDPQALESDLRAYLAGTAVPAKRWQLLGPSYAMTLRRILDGVIRRLIVQERREIEVADVLAAILLTDSPMAAMTVGPTLSPSVYRQSGDDGVHPVERMRGRGFRLVDALAWMAHGDAARGQARAGGDADLMATVLHNDDFTPMDYVVGVMREEFGLTEPAARLAALEAQRQCRVVVDMGPRSVAVPRAQRVVAAARAAGHPLLFTVINAGR